jgi:hypothetical protein
MSWPAAGAVGGLIVGAASSVSSGLDLEGMAAVIAASAGLFSAVTALVLGLRTKKDDKADARDELLMELLAERYRRRGRKPKPGED